MLRKYFAIGGLIAALCLSGCSNGSELPGYNAKSIILVLVCIKE